MVFTFAYLVLMLKVKSRLMRNSQYIANANQIQVKIIQESLGSIRDIILNKAYKTFIDIYKNIDINMRLKMPIVFFYLSIKECSGGFGDKFF